ncbi:hypothetical protein THIOM_004176 [Candidatus Thiomargarita nelsonii]|uniref:Uncharacterized protein n=1 Tax=Candidatus Thiomargarita nelsonii TaxID=1003181 RepID=A0A0A6P003_9GAMM|nr:hypothetical protein THIOM_004176 [Candidatus Thiomargarita nelsonii]
MSFIRLVPHLGVQNLFWTSLNTLHSSKINFGLLNAKNFIYWQFGIVPILQMLLLTYVQCLTIFFDNERGYIYA